MFNRKTLPHLLLVTLYLTSSLAFGYKINWEEGALRFKTRLSQIRETDDPGVIAKIIEIPSPLRLFVYHDESSLLDWCPLVEAAFLASASPHINRVGLQDLEILSPAESEHRYLVLYLERGLNDYIDDLNELMEVQRKKLQEYAESEDSTGKSLLSLQREMKAKQAEIADKANRAMLFPLFQLCRENMIYADYKAEQVIKFDDDRWALADFGALIPFALNNHFLRTFTQWCLDPRAYSGRFDQKTDVWPYALCTCECALGLNLRKDRKIKAIRKSEDTDKPKAARAFCTYLKDKICNEIDDFRSLSRQATEITLSCLSIDIDEDRVGFDDLLASQDINPADIPGLGLKPPPDLSHLTQDQHIAREEMLRLIFDMPLSQVPDPVLSPEADLYIRLEAAANLDRLLAHLSDFLRDTEDNTSWQRITPVIALHIALGFNSTMVEQDYAYAILDIRHMIRRLGLTEMTPSRYDELFWRFVEATEYQLIHNHSPRVFHDEFTLLSLNDGYYLTLQDIATVLVEHPDNHTQDVWEGILEALEPAIEREEREEKEEPKEKEPEPLPIISMTGFTPEERAIIEAADSTDYLCGAHCMVESDEMTLVTQPFSIYEGPASPLDEISTDELSFVTPSSNPNNEDLIDNSTLDPWAQTRSLRGPDSPFDRSSY